MTRQFLTAMAVFVAAAGTALGQEVVTPLPEFGQAAPPATYISGPDNGLVNYGAADPAGVEGPFFRYRIRSEAIYWYIQGTNYPALLTTSPDGTARADAGVLGRPDTSILAGGKRENEAFTGYRLSVTRWFDQFEDSGLEVAGFGIQGDNNLINATSDGNPILARPFINAQTGLPDAQLIAFPGIVTGSITANTRQSLFGFEINGRQNLKRNSTTRMEFIYGLRYLQLEDDIDIDETFTSIDPLSPVIPGTSLTVSDAFDSTTYTGLIQFGLETEVRNGIFGVEFFAKLGIGASVQTWRINGVTTATVPGLPPVTAGSGLFANTNNLGTYTQRYIDFAFVPELGLNFTAHFTERLTGTVGYNFMYIYPATRPGDVLKLPIVDPALLSPTGVANQRPSERNIGGSDVWVQGIVGRLEFKF